MNPHSTNKSHPFATIQLKRNLRKAVLRGHPWIYSEALQMRNGENQKNGSPRVQMAKVLDQNKEFLAWGLYDLNSPLAIRILSLNKSLPNEETLKKKIQTA